MRLLELLILLLTFFAPVLPLFLRGESRRWLLGLVLVDGLLVILHLLLEGYRWQMIPAYLLVALLLGRLIWWRSRPPQGVGSGTAVVTLLGLIFFIVAAVLPFLFPVPNVPEPTGPYAVGTTTVHLVDASRTEIYTGEPDDVREIMVQVWYPAAAAEGVRAPYIDNLEVAGPAVARRLNLPSFILDHVNLVKTNSFLEAPVAETGPFPLLVFSHGLRGLRVQNTVLIEYLASHGYVVASIDHTYGNVLTVFPENRVAFYNEQLVFPDGLSMVEAGARLVDVWAADVVFVVDWLSEQMASDLPFAGQVDLRRVGTLGHSTGGGTALEACAALTYCQGVVGLDAWIEPVEDALVEAYPEPLLLLSAPEWLGPENKSRGQRLYEGRAATGDLLAIAGTEHFDFSDLAMLSPLLDQLGMSGPIDSERVSEIINRYTLAFFDQQLKRADATLLRGPDPDYPEVTFE